MAFPFSNSDFPGEEDDAFSDAAKGDFDFDRVSGLTIECRQKLKRYSPRTIAQASRISGVSPSDISVLLLYFGR